MTVALSSSEPPTLGLWGKTGRDLPALFRDAIESLNSELARRLPGSTVTTADVVLITDLRRFGQQMNIADLSQFDELQMFVAKNSLPIYVIADRPDMHSVIEIYEHGRDKCLRYSFAAMLGHEWQHAYLHEAGEVQPYSFELELLRGFSARGLMPTECILDIQHTERRLQDAQQANEKHQDPQLHILLKGHP